jgi:hypothetical protein
MSQKNPDRVTQRRRPEPEDVQRFLDHADVKLLQADFASGEARTALLDEARDLLILGEMRHPGSGAWRLACVSARMGQEKLCLKWLERARKTGTLPAKEIVAGAAELEAVHDKHWFKAFVRELDA